jgi:dTDP-4-dehydrorhamnose reductase
LGVVNDQIGAPTDALGLAQVLWLLAAQHLAAKASALPLASEVPPDIYHWSDDGEISWYDFATEIQRQARPLGLLVNDATLRAIGTIDYPTPARRPAYSVLNCALLTQRLGKQQASWQDNLRRVLGVLAAST